MKPAGTKFRVLAEIALRQPKVKQAEVAEALSITPQAASDFFRKLSEEGLIKGSQGSYSVTEEGLELLISGARELLALSRELLEEVESRVKVITAIAEERVEKGQRVAIEMRKGLLYARREDGASGIAVINAEKGEDLGVKLLEGKLSPGRGKIRIVRVPPIERGGSRKADLELLKQLAKKSDFVAALGIEALVALKKAEIKAEAFFGSACAALEAAQHGCSVLIAAVEDELFLLMEKVERSNVEYRIY